MKTIGRLILAVIACVGSAFAGDKEECQAIGPKLAEAIKSNKACVANELRPRRAALNTLLSEVRPLVVAVTPVAPMMGGPGPMMP